MSHHRIRPTLSEPPTVNHGKRVMLHVTFHQCYLNGNKVSKSEGTRKAGEPLHCSTCAFELKVIKISPWLLPKLVCFLETQDSVRSSCWIKAANTCTTTKAPNQRNYLATNALTCNSNLIRNVETAHITYIHIW